MTDSLTDLLEDLKTLGYDVALNNYAGRSFPWNAYVVKRGQSGSALGKDVDPYNAVYAAALGAGWSPEEHRFYPEVIASPRVWIRPGRGRLMATVVIALCVALVVAYATMSLFWGVVFFTVAAVFLVGCDGFVNAILVEYDRTQGEKKP